MSKSLKQPYKEFEVPSNEEYFISHQLVMRLERKDEEMKAVGIIHFLSHLYPVETVERGPIQQFPRFELWTRCLR